MLSIRVIRVQGELVGHFWETEIFIPLRSNFEDFSKSLSLFWLGRIFPWTLKYKESIGESLRSVASLCLEILKWDGRDQVYENLENHENLNFWSSSALKTRIWSHRSLRQGAIFKDFPGTTPERFFEHCLVGHFGKIKKCKNEKLGLWWTFSSEYFRLLFLLLFELLSFGFVYLR